MKKWILALVVLFATVAYGQAKIIAQKLIQPEYITVTIDSITAQTIYYTFPPPQGITSSKRTAISTTALTLAAAQAKSPDFSATGDLFIGVVLDTLTRSDVDSLYMFIKPLWYDKTKETWYTSTKDSTFLVFDTAGTYTSTSLDYLTWVHGSGYSTTLSNELWPCAGIALTINRVSRNIPDADITAYFSFWIVR